MTAALRLPFDGYSKRSIKEMKSILIYFMALASTLSSIAETASLVDTVFHSKDGTHRIEISPPPIWPSKPGHCNSTLLAHSNSTDRIVWTRHLINNYAPVRIFVSNSGTSVVTMDEWGGHEDSQAQFPLVIYGFRGALVRVYNYSELSDWSRHAIVFFGPKDRVLFVRLDTGTLLIFDLGFGDVMNNEWFEIHKGWPVYI